MGFGDPNLYPSLLYLSHLPYASPVYVPGVKLNDFLTGSTFSRVMLASLKALLAASIIAFEVIVAPDITSTSTEFASIIWAGIISNALPPISGVSFSPTASMEIIFPASIVKVTSTSPPNPFAADVKTIVSVSVFSTSVSSESILTKSC